MSSTSYNAGRSMGIAHAYFAHKGYGIAMVVNETKSADMLVCPPSDGRQVWHSVQVKTAYKDRGKWVANTCRTTPTGRKPYEPGEVEYFFIEVPGEGMLFLTHKDVAGRDRIYPMSPEFKPWFERRWF